MKTLSRLARRIFYVLMLMAFLVAIGVGAVVGLVVVIDVIA